MMQHAATLLMAALLVACQDRPLEGAPVPVVSAAQNKPVDHLAPGELLPGTENAFALVLPRGFRVRARFAASVLADGESSAVHLGAYIAARVKDGHANLQPSKALFEGVRAPEEPGRILTIRIEEQSPGFCTVQVNDDTPPPDPGGDVAERLKRNGRSADGKLEGRDKME